VWKELEGGRVPREDADFGGSVEHLPSKASDMLRRGDVLAFFAPGGGGFGDPLDREAARVANDVANGWVSRERARENYGVALNEDGSVDEAATRSLRDQILSARRQRPTVAWSSDDHCEPPSFSTARPRESGDPEQQARPSVDSRLRGNERDDRPWRAAENIDLTSDGTLHCRRCGERLSGADGRIALSERPLSAASPWMALRHHGDGPNFVLEEISCPSCATLLGVREVRRNHGNS
jgi:hypothetical protein